MTPTFPPTISASSSTINSLDELLNLHGETFIQGAYQALLGRNPDPEGRNYYLARLKRGVGKRRVIAQIALSKEVMGRTLSLPGLKSFLTEHQKQRHWLSGWWYRQQEILQALHRVEDSLGNLHLELEALKQASIFKASFGNTQAYSPAVAQVFNSGSVDAEVEKNIPLQQVQSNSTPALIPPNLDIGLLPNNLASKERLLLNILRILTLTKEGKA